jgi:hypothetical protein
MSKDANTSTRPLDGTVAAPVRATPAPEHRHRAATDRNHAIRAFVQRTTKASNVAEFVEDLGVIEQIARVLS